MAHPCLGGGAGLALALSQSFKFLSSLPTSLSLNSPRLAILLPAPPHSLFLQSGHHLFPDVKLHHFAALLETPQWFPIILRITHLWPGLHAYIRIWPPSSFPPIVLTRGGSGEGVPQLLSAPGFFSFHISEPSGTFSNMANAECFSFQLKLHFLRKSFLPPLPSLWQVRTHWVPDPHTSKALAVTTCLTRI